MKFWSLAGLGLTCTLAACLTAVMGWEEWEAHEYIASVVYWTMTCVLGSFAAVCYSAALLDRDPE